MSTWRAKLLYDGACPFCRREVAWLKRRDRYGSLATEDISDPAFDAARYGLTREVAMRSLHAVLPDGRVVRGMEAVRQAYRAIGLGWVVAPTRWPVVRSVCDRFYDAFAKNRARLGRLVTGRAFVSHSHCACEVADRPMSCQSAAKRAVDTRPTHNWIEDADRQPFFPRKQTIQRRGIKTAPLRGPHKFARH
jgi:predicted DCC family thiol-disulfide oxidoreductase YuxK